MKKEMFKAETFHVYCVVLRYSRIMWASLPSPLGAQDEDEVVDDTASSRASKH